MAGSISSWRVSSSFPSAPYLPGEVPKLPENGHCDLPTSIRKNCTKVEATPPVHNRNKLFRLTKSSRRTPTSPEERLVVTLRFLSGAGSFRSLSYSFRLGVSTIAVIVKETCEAIYEELHAKYLRAPNTPNEWLEIANGFWERWKCPNTLGRVLPVRTEQ